MTLLRAACDPALYSSTVRLLVLLVHDLSDAEYRPLKLWPIAQRLGMKPHTIGSGLRVLVREGYLQQETTAHAKRYRLALQRHQSPSAALAPTQLHPSPSPYATTSPPSL